MSGTLDILRAQHERTLAYLRRRAAHRGLGEREMAAVQRMAEAQRASWLQAGGEPEVYPLRPLLSDPPRLEAPEPGRKRRRR